MLAINLPADGLFLAIQNHANGNLSRENCKRIMEEYLDKILEAKPDVIMLNVCYRRSLVPSQVFDSYLYNIETDEKGFAVRDDKGETVKKVGPVGDASSKYFAVFFKCAHELIKNGIDIYEFAIEHIKKTNTRVFLSVRMNDEHFPDNRAINSSFAFKNGGEHTIDKDGRSLDYSQEAVRNYYFEYIKELVTNYKVDGVEMDWLRYPNVLPLSKANDLSILSDYMKKVRQLLDTYDKNLSLAVRILPTEEALIRGGFDVSGWISDGSVDILTIENFYIPTNYQLPVKEWRDSIDKRNKNGYPYKILCGSDWAVSCVSKYDLVMNPALVRGFAEASISSGADGVYLFNFFEEDDYSSFELITDENGAHLRTCFSERIIAANQPNALPRRYVHIGCSNEIYPINLESGGVYSLNKTIKAKYKKCRLIIGCKQDLPFSVSVNGALASKFTKEPVYEGYEYLPKEEVKKKGLFIYSITQAAPCVISVDLTSAINGKENFEVQIKNSSKLENEIFWLEIVCE